MKICPIGTFGDKAKGYRRTGEFKATTALSVRVQEARPNFDDALLADRKLVVPGPDGHAEDTRHLNHFWQTVEHSPIPLSSRISVQFDGVRMLKIQRKANGKVIITLNGRIETEDLDELRRLLELERAGSHIAFDLKDVTLVDRDAITFLNDCEANSIKLENCPPYVRDRIQQQLGRPGRKKRNARADKVQKRERRDELE